MVAAKRGRELTVLDLRFVTNLKMKSLSPLKLQQKELSKARNFHTYDSNGSRGQAILPLQKIRTLSRKKTGINFFSATLNPITYFNFYHSALVKIVLCSWEVDIGIFKTCVRYFSLFLKDKCIYSLFRTKYVEKKFNLQLFFLPTVPRTFILSGATRRSRLIETSCLEKITVCVIETMPVTLPLVQMYKARREGNRTNQVQTKIKIMKGLQTSVIHVIPGSKCHWMSNRMRFFKKYLSVEIFSSDN